MRICIYVLARFTFLIFFLVASIAAPIFNFLTYCLPPQLKDLTSLQCHSLPHSPAMEMSLTNLTTLPSPTPFQLLQSAITVSSNIHNLPHRLIHGHRPRVGTMKHNHFESPEHIIVPVSVFYASSFSLYLRFFVLASHP